MNVLEILAADKSNILDGAKKAGVSGVNGDLTGSIGGITTAIFALLGIVAVFVIILGGFNMMTSSGDPGKVKKGKDTILWGVIGLVVCILSYAIVQWVVNNIFK